MDFIFDPSLVLYLPLGQLDGTSFLSREAYGHLCTVIGATWGHQGRTFDGVDDRISLPVNNVFEITGGTVIAWIYRLTDTTINHWITDIRPSDGSAGWFYVMANTNTLAVSQGTTYVDKEPTTTVGRDAWHHVVVAGLNMGNGAAGSAIGDRYSHIAGNNMHGNIREVWVYNRALSTTEIQRNYEETRWRYR